MTKSLKNLWARLLFQDRGIVPTRRLLIIVAGFGIGVTILAGLLQSGWIAGIVTGAVFILISLADLLVIPKKKDIHIQRELNQELERGLDYSVTLSVTNDSHYDGRFIIKDDVPHSCEAVMPIETTLAQHNSKQITYQLTPFVRGNYQMATVFIRFGSRFGLWQKQMAIPTVSDFKVIPDLSETRDYLEDAQQFLLQEGVKIRKQAHGEGEFAQIRQYVIGDDPRKINWRQTAKLQELMTNVHEPEHNKQIMILIDCSRMMGAELSKGNRLERALEGAMTVAAAALRNGDYVGVIAFGKQVKVHVQPEKGMSHMQTILHAIYHLEVEPGESNYAEMLTYIQASQKKRSLLMLFTDIHTFLHEESALFYLEKLRRRHLFMMIGVEDEDLMAKTNIAPGDVQDAMVKTIAQQQIHIAKQKKAKWQQRGLLMIEAKEERLANSAVSNYIRIMNQGLL